MPRRSVCFFVHQSGFTFAADDTHGPETLQVELSHATPQVIAILLYRSTNKPVFHVQHIPRLKFAGKGHTKCARTFFIVCHTIKVQGMALNLAVVGRSQKCIFFV